MLNTSNEGTYERAQRTIIQEKLTLVWDAAGRKEATMNPARRETKVATREESVDARGAQWFEGNSLVLLQVNCRSIFNKGLDFWNLIDTYNPDVVIGTESWLREEISNAEVFRADYTTFRRDRCSRGGGVFICVKNYIACEELWVDDDFEMITVAVKGRDPKFTWEIVGIYRALNEDMRVIDRLAARTGYVGNTVKQHHWR
jgi:hypothetical protein